MATRIDLIIFGATGFTGRYTIPIIHKLTRSNGRSLSWGIAGRSEDKLKKTLQEVGDEEKLDLANIPVIVADVQDAESLTKMTAQARCIVNCCGPYRFYGEPVVKACIETGTHHVDVSGEPQYMERMALEYHEQAKEKGVYIVSACGLDSVPADLGAVFLEQEFGGTLNSVVTFLEGDSSNTSGPLANYGTWESAVYGIAHENELKDLRKQLFPKPLPKCEPKLKINMLPHTSPLVKGWVLPFPGSDRAVMKRTQRYFYETESKRPIQVATYFVVKSFFYVLAVIFFGLIFQLFSKFEQGRKLLLKYPKIFSAGVFSHDKPIMEDLKKIKFKVTIYGEGWKERLAEGSDQYTSPVDKSITGTIEANNPGYGFTGTSLALCGIVILTEPDKLPAKGGVYPPGAAFAKTSLIKQLQENDVKFTIVEEKDLKLSSSL